MTMRRGLWAISLFAAAAVALAGAQGRMTGTVTGTDGTPLAGVIITVTTPNITTFKMTTKTDKNGHYGLIVNDATIPYNVRWELEGYVPHEEKNLKISLGDPTVMDVKLPKPEAVQAAVMSTTDQAAVAYNDGVEKMNAGDEAGAEAKFHEAVAKNPDQPQGWQALAVIAFRKKDWAKVLENGQKATDLDPSMSNLYQMMAVAAGQQGDKKAAAAWQAKYAEANPNTPETFYNKGVEALNAKKMKEARDFFNQAIEARPDYALAHYQLGLVSFNLKDNAAAKEHLQKYLELDPNGSEADTAKELLAAMK